MTRNVSNLDRIIRVVIAVVSAIAAMSAGSSGLAIVLYLVAAIMLGTAAMGFCPLYRVFGLSTKK